MAKVDISSTIDSLIIDGNLIKLPSYFGQLPDAEFKELKKQMSNIGGQWKTNMQGWLFKTDPSSFLNTLRDGKEVNIFQDNQFFFTPKPVFDYMVNWPDDDWELELPYGKVKFLEPEAGEGHIIEYFKERYSDRLKDVTIECCEPFHRNQELLKNKGFNIIADDFMSLGKKYNNYYDVVIANPPFAENAYIDHIYKMYDVTREGGAILTVAPDNYNKSNDKKRIEFKEWLKSVHALEKQIPSPLFKANKAGAKTNVIWIDVLYS